MMMFSDRPGNDKAWKLKVHNFRHSTVVSPDIITHWATASPSGSTGCIW